MIARSQPKIEPADWQHALREAHARPAELLAALGLTAAEVGLSAAAAADFAFRVPRPWAARIRPGDFVYADEDGVIVAPRPLPP